MLALRSRSFSFLTVLALVTACGGKHDAATADTAAAQPETAAATPAAAPAATAPASTSAADAPLTVADIDRWQKGMAAELQAVQDAAKQLHDAKSGNDTVTAMFATNETSTLPAGAKAAGVDEERYKFIRSTLSTVVGEMSPISSEMNTKDMPPQMVAQLQQGRDQALARSTATMAPDVVAALKPRAAALRKQDLELTAARLKAAGAVH